MATECMYGCELVQITGQNWRSCLNVKLEVVLDPHLN